MGISQARKHMNETLFINEESKSAFVYHMDTNLTTGERGEQARVGPLLCCGARNL